MILLLSRDLHRWYNEILIYGMIPWRSKEEEHNLPHSVLQSSVVLPRSKSRERAIPTLAVKVTLGLWSGAERAEN